MGPTRPARSTDEAPAVATATIVLLVCGIISAALYIGTDIVASILYPGYNYANQMVSELGAIGAPTRPLWFAMSMLYNPLVLAFGIGVWRAAGSRRSLRMAALALIAYGIVSAAGPFVPMQVRGSAMALTDVLHIVCTAGMLVFMFLFIGFGANASGRGFLLYSIATIAALLVGGALAGVAGAQIAAGGDTPWMGLLERLNIYSDMLWIAVLGITLLRAGMVAASGRPFATRAAVHAAATTTLAR